MSRSILAGMAVVALIGVVCIAHTVWADQCDVEPVLDDASCFVFEECECETASLGGMALCVGRYEYGYSQYRLINDHTIMGNLQDDGDVNVLCYEHAPCEEGATTSPGSCTGEDDGCVSDPSSNEDCFDCSHGDTFIAIEHTDITKVCGEEQ